MSVLIDAHVHFWRIGHNDCAWPPPALAAIHRDFLPDDWALAGPACGVNAAIAVQSQASGRDTAWLLELARDDPRIVGVVGWTDLAAPDAADHIAALSSHPKLCGLRPMLQDLPDDDWILQPALAPAIDAMVAHDLGFDALVQPRHLSPLRRFAQRHPALRIVIDHAAKPGIAHTVLDPWRAQMAALAELPNVACKLSGLVTETGGRTDAEMLQPYVGHLLETFGPQRLLWGSDWPVLNLACDYAAWLRMADALTGLAGAEKAAVFGGNAARFYGVAGAGFR